MHPIDETPVPTETARPASSRGRRSRFRYTAAGKMMAPVSPVVAESTSRRSSSRSSRSMPMFTPLGPNQIHAPGTGGGANYGPVSYSPQTGYLYVNAIDAPTNSGRGPKGYFSAYDPKTGELVWQKMFDGWGQAGSVVTAERPRVRRHRQQHRRLLLRVRRQERASCCGSSTPAPACSRRRRSTW